MRSYQKNLKFKALLLSAFNKIQKIYAQSEVDRQNFIKFGVMEEKCLVIGNLKFDVKTPRTMLIEFPQKIVWCAGSTRENEEKILLNANF